jgi:hypothetical protein
VAARSRGSLSAAAPSRKKRSRKHSISYLGGGTEDTGTEQPAGEPGVGPDEREAEEERVLQGVVHGGHGEPSRGGGGQEERAEPLGEGAKIRAEEGVDGVDSAVVWAEAAMPSDPRQRRPA